MNILQLILLALVQGLTEFLPISSSAHLLLPQFLLGWADQGLMFDAAVHLGSLLAVVLYFRQRLGRLALSGARVLGGRRDRHWPLLLALIVGTVPAAAGGWLLSGFVDAQMRTPQVVVAATAGGALALLWLHWRRPGALGLDALDWRHGLIIGASQLLAICLPGLSRSAVTMVFALLLGFGRRSAAEFSFLLAVPIIALAGGLGLWRALGDPVVLWQTLVAMAVAAAAAWLAIHWFLQLVERIGLLPFAVYRLLLAGLLVLLLW